MNELENVISNMKTYVRDRLLTKQNEGEKCLEGFEINDELVSSVLADYLAKGYNPDVMGVEFVLESFRNVYLIN